MSGARQELIELGTLGAMGYALLEQTVRQVVRMRNLPPPPGIHRWDDDAVLEAAHDVFAARDGAKRLVTLAASTHDEASFRSALWTTVARDLTSAGRRTERGSLAERVLDVRQRMPEVEEHAGRLQLIDVTATTEPRYDELVDAASRVEITVPAWSEQSERRSPLADRSSFVALITAVLARCPSGLPISQLVDVLAVRLGVHDAPLAHDHTMLDEYARTAPDDPAGDAAVRDDARTLLARMTAAQRLVLPYVDDAATEIAARTGLGRTKAWRTAREVKEVLAEALTDIGDRARVLRAAIEIAVAEADRRMIAMTRERHQPDSASEP